MVRSRRIDILVGAGVTLDDLAGYTLIGTPGADAQATLQAALDANSKVAIVDDGHGIDWDCDSSIFFDSNDALYVDLGVNLWRNYNSTTATSSGFLRNRSFAAAVNNVKIWGGGNIAARQDKGGNMLSFWANNFVSKSWTTTYFLRHTMIAGNNIYFGYHNWRVDSSVGSGGAGLRFAGGDGFVGEYLNVISGDDVYQCVPAGAPTDPLWNVADGTNGIYRHCVGRSQSGRLISVGLQDQNTGGDVSLGMTVAIDNWLFLDVKGFGGGSGVNVAEHSSVGDITNIKFDDVAVDQRDTLDATHGQPGETFAQREATATTPTMGIVDNVDFGGTLFAGEYTTPRPGVTVYNKRSVKFLTSITAPFGGVTNVTTANAGTGNLALDTETLLPTPSLAVAEPLGGGGWVTGIALSPDGLTRLVRTDTLGGWRWDTTTDQWEPLLAQGTAPSPYSDLDVGEGVQALAAANDRAYMAYNDAVLTSTDRGVTWSLSATGIETGPNAGGGQKRWNRHMAVDPANSQRCIYGSINSGLWYTTNGGTSWTQVPSGTLPFGTDGASPPNDSTTNGIPCVLIDAAGNWWAAPFASGLWRSTNLGVAWTKISNDTDIMAVTGLDYGPNGDIMVAGSLSPTSLTSANARVFRYRSGVWTQMVMPGTARQWRNVAYDRLTAGRVMIQGDGGYARLTTDYGDNWGQTPHTFSAPAGDVPWLEEANGAATGTAFFTTIGGLQFDPVVTNRVWMSQGIGVWYADLTTPTTDATAWQAQTRGLEQLVINDALAPPGGNGAGGGVLTVGWDRPIFLPGEVAVGGTYPEQYHPDFPTFGSAWHMDYSADNPDWLAASIGNHQTIDGSPSGYSTDGGLTWTPFATRPTNGTNFAWAGSMHVGAPGHAMWVSASGRGTYYTTDSGASWTPVTIAGITMSTINTMAYFVYRRPACSEKTAGSADTFYLYVPGASGGIYRSTDGGANWTQRCAITPFGGTDFGWHIYLKAVPGKPGHLFFTPGFLGGKASPTLGLPFMRSTDGGATWTTLTTIDTVRGFDFGVGSPGSTYPAIYVIGYVGGVRGVYRSDDNAATWTLLSTQPHGTVDFIRNMAASKEIYGKHWITTGGSGLIVGGV